MSESKNVFVVTSAGIEHGTSVKMQAATFRERKDLQEWLIDIPELAKRFVREATGRETSTLRGPDWWTYDRKSLVDLAQGSP